MAVRKKSYTITRFNRLKYRLLTSRKYTAWAIRKAEDVISTGLMIPRTLIIVKIGSNTTKVWIADTKIGTKKRMAICSVADLFISPMLSPVLDKDRYMSASLDNSACSLKYRKLADDSENINATKAPIKLNTDMNCKPLK